MPNLNPPNAGDTALSTFYDFYRGFYHIYVPDKVFISYFLLLESPFPPLTNPWIYSSPIFKSHIVETGLPYVHPLSLILSASLKKLGTRERSRLEDH
jgi:hypothetical protein